MTSPIRLVFLLMLGFGTQAFAQIYKWTDA